MGIELDQYRQNIGTFYSSGNIIRKSSKSMKMKQSAFKPPGQQSFLYIFIVSILCITSAYYSQYLSYKATTHKLPTTYSRDNFTLKWGTTGLSNNKLQCIINGNRRTIGYKFAVWNCERGLLGGKGPTSKLQDIKLFIQKKKPHVFGIIESDIYSPKSTNRRINRFTTAEVKSYLNIDGYTLELPDTWDTHGQARLLAYVSNDIKYNRKILVNSHTDLPSITLEVGLGRATKSIVNYYYREWTSGVSGDSSTPGQQDRLGRHISQWEESLSQDRDFVSLGDANLCAMSWNKPDFKHKNLANQVGSFLLDNSCHQLVNNYTRVQSYADTVQRSCLDHVTTNVPGKCSVPEISAGGSSDHMAVLITKFSREVKNQPKTIKKRNYKISSLPIFCKKYLIMLLVEPLKMYLKQMIQA